MTSAARRESGAREATPGEPVMPEVEQHLLTPASPGVGRVVETYPCTAGRKAAGFVRHISIDVSGTPLAGRFRAGQSFGVIPPGVDKHAKPHKLRLYSIASPSRGEDGAGQVLSTTVKRTIDEHWDDHTLFLGVASNYLCDLKEGDEVTITGPAGKRFVLPADPSAHDYVFFATGTGIAPFRAMLKELYEGDAPTCSRVTLVMGSPYASDLLYHQELRAMEEKHEGFTYLTAISRERDLDAGEGLYVQDRLRTHADLLVSMLESERTIVYICGIAGMELGILQGMGRTLKPEHLAGYVTLGEGTPTDPLQWDRRMIPRSLRPSRRVLMEVY
ncbi:MAG: hypothetical protein R3B57_01940 [Phycisphaerales bacterium]